MLSLMIKSRVKLMAGNTQYFSARWLLLVFLFACSHANSYKLDHILFILSKNSPEYQEIVNSVATDWNDNKAISYEVLINNKQNDLDKSLKKSDLVVSIGSAATESIMARKISQPLITTLITESVFNSLAKKYYGDSSEAVSLGVNPIFLDQPFERRLKLACRLINQLDRVGVMVGPLAVSNQEFYASSISEKSLKPQMIAIDPDENPVRQLDPVIKSSDVFIPIADSHFINVTTAKWILQLGYRYRVPVIGYSANYVDAGALASVYSSPENVSKQIAELIQSLRRENHKHQIHTPKYCTIKFNKSVAWHLNLDIPDNLLNHNGYCDL
jgi:putative ABC transport system substrate-binding protein